MLPILTILILAPLPVLRAAEASTLPSKPNVLLIMADDLSDFGRAFTKEVVKMPNLDRLRAHGTTFERACHTGERRWWNKNTLFERSCRGPLVIAAPGLKGGQASRSLVEFIDIYPTIADFCGLKMPHAAAGANLRPILADASARIKDAAFTLVTRGPKLHGRASAPPAGAAPFGTMAKPNSTTMTPIPRNSTTSAANILTS